MKLKVIIGISLILFVSLFFYYIKKKGSYKQLPSVLNEKTCMRILKKYQPNINKLDFESIDHENYKYKQLMLKPPEDLDGMGDRSITFVFNNQEFEGCNIMDNYVLFEKLSENGEEIDFKKYFDCEKLECKNITCDNGNGHFFYTYRKFGKNNNSFELKYYKKDKTLEGNVSIDFQFLYFNRPLDDFIENIKNSMCQDFDKV